MRLRLFLVLSLWCVSARALADRFAVNVNRTDVLCNNILALICGSSSSWNSTAPPPETDNCTQCNVVATFNSSSCNYNFDCMIDCDMLISCEVEETNKTLNGCPSNCTKQAVCSQYEHRSTMNEDNQMWNSSCSCPTTSPTIDSTSSPPDSKPSAGTMTSRPPTRPRALDGEELYPVLFSVAGAILLVVVALVIILGCIFLQCRRYRASLYAACKGEGKSRTAARNRRIADIPSIPLVQSNNSMTAETDISDEADMHRAAISIAKFNSHVKQMHENANSGFEDEFELLDFDVKASFEISKLPQNEKKNRFENISPYDFSRVTLTEVEDVPGSDYINASFIDGYDRPNAYIAAQGPLRHTIYDFWRMVQQYKVSTVVMVTQTVEGGRDKCEQYWPALLNTEWQVGPDLAVTLTEQQQFAEFSVKTLTLTDPTKDPNGLEPLLSTTHFHFTAWPDHGVPADKTCLIHFIQRVRKNHPYYSSSPMIVHCSAGVGRSGTFIVLDSMLERMKKVDTLNIFEFVEQMRMKRVNMVQTEAQYIFVHDALNEFITCGDTSITVTNMRITLRNLEKKGNTNKTGFQEQFELLKQVSFKPTPVICSDGLSDHNAAKNRYMDKVPYNITRVYIKSTAAGINGADYINASFVDGYKHRRAFIATQGPLKSTVSSFWQMVWQNKCRAIVTLCDLTEDEEESCYQFWPATKDKSDMHGKLLVRLVSEESKGEVVTRKIEVIEDTHYHVPGAPNHAVLSQFHHTGWSKTEPPETSSTLKIIDALIKTQMMTGNGPIAVLCNDGMSRTGAFIAIYAQLERIKSEGMADVFQCVKAMRIQRPTMVTKLHEFQYCHQVLADYLDTMDNYANFKDLDSKVCVL